MEMLRRNLSPIGKQLGALNTTQKLLIACVVIILVLSLYLVSRATARPTLVELLPGAAVADQQRAATFLSGLGVTHSFVNDRLMVSPGDVARSQAALAEARQLPNDKALFFENLIAQQSWMNSRQQNDQAYTLALQNELARMIEGFAGVRSASVILDVPEVRGLGQAVRKPTASATVATDSGGALGQGQVDAIAALIAGSRAGLEVERVRVIDAATGRQRRPSGEEDSTPGTLLEHAAKVESQTRDKVMELLSYIPGVMVAVTAQVDVSRSRAQVDTNLPERQGTLSLVATTKETAQSSSEASQQAEPGVGANQTADINRGGTSGQRTENTTTETTFENHVGRRSETIIDPKGHPISVAISVNVPRGFVAALSKPAADAPADAPAPSEQELAQRFEQEVRPKIVSTLTPHVRALLARTFTGMTDEQVQRMVDASIGVTLIPVDTLPAVVGGAGGSGAIAGLGGSLLGGVGVGGIVEVATLGVLAAAALGMMAMMVKKAAKRTVMPTAEELVGLPPQLETTSEVIGEADEGDMAMAGIEVGEEQMQAQKVLEQVSALVDADPAAAGKILNRWIDVNE